MNSVASQAVASKTDGQATGYPMVCLVDIDGFRVPSCERDIPDIQPEPCAADRWPAWTDLVRVHVGRRDEDAFAFGVLAGDIAGTLLDRLDAACACKGGHDDDDQTGKYEPTPPGGWSDPDPAVEVELDPHGDWDGSPHAGWMVLLPETGGSSEFEPSADDLADYNTWSESLERRRDAMDFPKPKTTAQSRQDFEDAVAWFRLHPGA
jgi:hypothetical protein